MDFQAGDARCEFVAVSGEKLHILPDNVNSISGALI